MKPTELLHSKILERLRIATPASPQESLDSTASAIVALGALNFDGQRLVPCGSRSAMAKCSLLAPALMQAVTRESVAAASAAAGSIEAQPVERARARLAALGVDLDAALAGDSSDSETFYGLTQEEINGITPRGAA